MKYFRLKSAMFVGVALLVLYAGQAGAVEADAGEPQVVAMHDVTDPNSPVDPNLLDHDHPAWPMAFETNPNSPLGPIPVTVKLNGSTSDPNVGVTVTWSVTDAAQASHVSIDDAGVLDPNVTFDDPNLYSLTLAVDDGTSVETDTVLIKVKLAGNALQAHWKFDGDPNDPNDYDWNYTGWTGSPGFGPGLVGNAMILKPGDSTTYGYDIGAETSISVAFWMRPASDFTSDSTGLVRKYSGDSDDPQGGWSFQLRSETQMRWRCSSGWDGGAGDLKVTDSFPVDTWMHIAGTFDGETGDMEFYKNGELIRSDNGSDSCFDWFIDEMTVGSDDFAGIIDELYLFDYPLDANEVIALVTKGRSLPPDIQLSEQVKVLLPATEVQLAATVENGMGIPTAAWTVLEKPAGATVILSDPAALVTTAQVDSVGNYRLSLTVTDEATPAQSDTAEIVIKVRPEDYDGLEAHITFADQTANSNLATSIPYVGELFGNPVWTEGIGGEANSAILLDGEDDHINYDAYIGSDPCCTIALWVGNDDITKDAHIIQKWASDTSGKGWMFRNRPDDNPGQIAIMIGSGFSGGGAYDVTDAMIPAVLWTHLAMTFDGSVCNLYMNGIQFFSQEIDPAFSPADLVTPMVIGYRWNDDTRFFKGAIDEVRIYDYALTADELRPLVAEGINVAPDIQLESDQVKILQPATTVQLNGTVVEEGPYTVAWEVVEKAAGATVTFDNSTVLATAVQVDSVGNYRLRVTVTEEGDSPLSDSAEMVIKVRPADFDGLEAHITFADQTANSNVSTSIPYVGELFGNPEFVEGVRGEGDYCIKLDGVDDHVNYNAYIGSDPCCTIAYWINHEAVDTDSHPIQKWASDTSGKGWMFRNRVSTAPGQIAFMIGSGFSGGGAYYATDVYVPADAWTHIGMTFDGSQVSLYMNGTLAFTDTEIIADYTPGDLVTPMVIGYRSNNDTRYFKGAMDEIHIYDYALSAEALEAIYKAEGGE